MTRKWEFALLERVSWEVDFSRDYIIFKGWDNGNDFCSQRQGDECCQIFLQECGLDVNWSDEKTELSEFLEWVGSWCRGLREESEESKAVRRKY